MPSSERITCQCPDDCNCRVPWRTNYCGCQLHTAEPSVMEVVAANAPDSDTFAAIVGLMHITRQFDDAGGQVPAIWREG